LITIVIITFKQWLSEINILFYSKTCALLRSYKAMPPGLISNYIFRGKIKIEET
jgi:hypothetical protein